MEQKKFEIKINNLIVFEADNRKWNMNIETLNKYPVFLPTIIISNIKNGNYLKRMYENPVAENVFQLIINEYCTVNIHEHVINQKIIYMELTFYLNVDPKYFSFVIKVLRNYHVKF